MTHTSSSKIGLLTATIIGMNAMIGSGIFTAPAALATYVGPAGILAYIFVVGAVWCMALSLARLAQLYPEEGSFYTYAKQWSGHTGGLIASSMYIVGLVIAMGLLSRVAGIYLHELIPSLSIDTLGLICLTTLVALNMFGVALSQLGQHILIVCTVFPLLAITAICFFHFDPKNLVPFAPHGFMHVLKATRLVIFGFFGFESAASLFSVVDKPEKNVPRALTYSIVIVGILYTAFISSLICAVPLSLFTSQETPLSNVIGNAFPGMPWFLYIIHLAILSAIIGTIHSMIWGSSALIVSLAKKLTCANRCVNIYSSERQHTAAVLLIGSLIATTFLTLKSINQFFNLTALFIVGAFILSMISLLILKDEWKTGRNIITLIGLITAGMMLYFAAEDFLITLF